MRIRLQYFIFFVVAFFCLSYHYSSARQIRIFKSNKTDRLGERHGRWKFYTDEENKLLFSKGKFSHGNATGVWKYYDSNGKLRRKEKYNRPCTSLKTTFYYPNGKIECSGFAKLNSEEGKLHYYWDGPWQYFDEKGNLIKIVIYKTGNEIGVEKFY